MDRNARGVLHEIVDAKRREVASLRTRAAELRRSAEGAGPARGFARGLRGPDVRVIAEFKRRSPSAGWIREKAEVAAIARSYEAAGAAALSILTDAKYFGGSLADLEEGRKVTRLPVLRKDFIIDEVQLFEARAHGADCALLIVRILTREALRDLLQTARAIGLDVLVETHDGAEVETALAAGARIIGVNNRDLSTFTTDPDLVLRIRPAVPGEVILVAESGIRDRALVERYGAAGIDAILVGEAFMREPDAAAAAHRFTGVRCERRTVTTG